MVQNRPASPARVSSGPNHHGYGEGQADTHADYRRQRLVRCCSRVRIRKQGHDCRGNSTSPLQHSAGDHPQMESASAASAAPAANTSNPRIITGRQCGRKGHKGICVAQFGPPP